VQRVIALACLGVSAAAACASAAVERTTAEAIRQNLLASCFVDPQEGWMVGDLARIFHTVDGGKTWELQTAGTKWSFVGLSCPDKSNVWASGQAGQIAHSSDGGKTWQLQKSGSDRQLLSIAFANAQRGLAVGDFGTLLRTDDGGQTWSKLSLPTNIKLPADVVDVIDPGDVVLYSVSFSDPDHAWAAGEFGVILGSSDGGLTWQPEDSPIETTLFSVHFVDQQHGWAVGLESTLLRTSDGGTTWQQQQIETPRGFMLALYDVNVLDKYGWAVGNSGLLLSTKDGGATWQVVQVPVQMRSTWFGSVSMFPEGRGLIVGRKGMILSADRDSFTPSKKQF